MNDLGLPDPNEIEWVIKWGKRIAVLVAALLFFMGYIVGKLF